MLPKISATLCGTNSGNTFKNYFFSKIFSQNRHFWFLILARKGVRLVRNFFLTWSLSIRSKTPWQTKKSNETSPRSYKYFFIPQHRFWMKFHDKSMKNADFDQSLEICNFANNPWNFLKPRLWIFWGRRVPIVLPKISASTYIRNYGNTFKICNHYSLLLLYLALKSL